MRTYLLLLALLPLQISAQSHGEIVGKAHTSDDRAVAYAAVSLYVGNYLLKTVFTDADGIFIFDNLQPGLYTVAARTANGMSKRVTVSVRSSGATYINLNVNRQAAPSADRETVVCPGLT